MTKSALLRPGSPDPRLSAAEAHFLDFLAQQEGATPLAFELFAQRHPEFERELRQLHHDWLGVARVAAQLRDDAPAKEAAPKDAPPQEAPAKEAARVDSELHLSAERDGPQFELAGALLRRLASERSSAGRYVRKGEIARGGMGVVHRVFDPILRRDLAMKVILARKSDETPAERERAMQRALARFLEEAQVTSQLDHPGIVPVHELGIDATGRVYFTMRLVRGRELRKVLDLVKRGEEGWTRTRALHVLLKACEAIAYAHDKQVIHRDLKPANVMVGRFGEVYVMDWGLARVLGRRDPHDLRVQRGSEASVVDTDVRRYGDATPGSPLLTMDGNVLGTPQYMSPEQADNRIDDMGPRSDVYSLGAILYELLAGHAPFTPPGTRISAREVWQALVSGPPPALADVAPDAPRELAEICGKAMARLPEERYATALELAAEIEAFLHHRPVGAHAPTLPYLARLWYERNRTLAHVVGAALMVVATLSLLFGWRHRVEQRRIERLEQWSAAEGLVAGAERRVSPEPADLPLIEEWLREVDALLPQEAAWAAELAAARARGDTLATRQLEAPLAALAELRSTLRPRLGAWAERLRTLAAASVAEPWAAAQWRAALADLRADPRFAGLELAPQPGLVPLRKDRASGLWEFWHLLSGARPAVDERVARGYALADDSALVLVLVPPGRATLGFPSAAEVKLTQSEAVVHHELAAPLLVSKFEVTQGQYLAVMGSNPSQYKAGEAKVDDRGRRHPFTALHPVESLPWSEASRFARRAGLELPRQADWEYFARAGAEGAVWWHAARELAPGVALERSDDPRLGAVVAGITAYENVFDRATAAVQGKAPFVDEEDGFAYHAPVGSFRANGFGLFDLLGNVSEWCEDPYQQPGMTLVRRDVRGGHWFQNEAPLFLLSRTATDNPATPQSVRGLRPVRAWSAGR